MTRGSFILFLPALLTGCRNPDDAPPTVTIAVASNFLMTAKAIGAEFSSSTGVNLVFVPGSTGKLVAQITRGAPFDVFLSADREAPAYLLNSGFPVGKGPVTYAVGRLALYGREPQLIDTDAEFPALDSFHHLAIANPDLAPYGRAAKETLIALGVWEPLQSRLVRGENISQTWHFVSSGNAELGFVAFSQLSGIDTRHYRLVPAHYHAPIEQDAVLINDTLPARRFFDFLTSPAARRIIESHGYDLPPRFDAE